MLPPLSHRFCAPSAQKQQRPHHGTSDVTLWSPGLTVLTPGPIASTTPAPLTAGEGVVGQRDVPGCEAVVGLARPAATMRTRISPSRGSSSSVVTISHGPGPSRRTAVFVFMLFLLIAHVTVIQMPGKSFAIATLKCGL
jgi:hypothetical protein